MYFQPLRPEYTHLRKFSHTLRYLSHVVGLILLSMASLSAMGSLTTSLSNEVNQNQTVQNPKQIPSYNVEDEIEVDSFKIAFIRDSLGSYTINEVAERSIDDVIPGRFDIPSTDGVYWFAFRIENDTDQSFSKVVRFDEVYMERASIYYVKDSSWYEEHSGLSVEIGAREVENRAPVFLVNLEANTSKTIYLRLNSKFRLSLGISIESPDRFLLKEQLHIVGYWFFFGAAIAIFLYNFFLLLSLRQKVYLYYCCYSFCFITFSFLYSGFSLYVIRAPWLHYDLHLSITLTGTFIFLFSRELLQTRLNLPKFDKVLKAVAIWYVVLSILVVIDIRFYHLLVLSGMPTMLILFGVGIYFLTRKHKLAKFYVLAMTGYLFGLAMIALVNIGGVPYNFFTRYGYLLGSLIEMIVFSLALAYRVKLLQKEKNRVQQELLGIEQRNKERLVLKVKERTQELQLSNNEVSRQRDELRSRNENIELLLKEIHHRVKNNLQVVSSLLDLQTREIEDERTLATFIEGQSRVKAMALIHQKLYQNEGLVSIDFGDYVEQLIKELIGVYLLSKKVNTTVNVNGNTQFDIDTAIPLGLILNELISNAFKYAYDGSEEARLNVQLDSVDNGQYCLTVSDNGKGLPEHFEFAKLKSLGLKLVRRLSKQLYGEVMYSKDGGARFTITFMDTVHRKAI